MNFEIEIRDGKTSYKMDVAILHINKAVEHFIISNKSGTQQLIIKSNRPFFRNRGIKHRIPDFTLISGTVHYASRLEQVLELIMKQLEP